MNLILSRIRFVYFNFFGLLYLIILPNQKFPKNFRCYYHNIINGVFEYKITSLGTNRKSSACLPAHYDTIKVSRFFLTPIIAQVVLLQKYNFFWSIVTKASISSHISFNYWFHRKSFIPIGIYFFQRIVLYVAILFLQWQFLIYYHTKNFQSFYILSPRQHQ